MASFRILKHTIGDIFRAIAILSKIDECDIASDIVKSVDILCAIRWVVQAWGMVEPVTISRCFWRAGGVLTGSMDVVS